ncbi:unnamed protein product, partial [Ostreobium quekettii]
VDDAPKAQHTVQLSDSADADNVQLPSSDLGLMDTVVTVGGLVSVPIMAWSLFALRTTGCGLPPGPGGLLGGLEGVSYLAVVAIAGRSLMQRVSSSADSEVLPTSPAGVLGLVETLSYAALLAGVVVFALTW